MDCKRGSFSSLSCSLLPYTSHFLSCLFPCVTLRYSFTHSLVLLSHLRFFCILFVYLCVCICLWVCVLYKMRRTLSIFFCYSCTDLLVLGTHLFPLCLCSCFCISLNVFVFVSLHAIYLRFSLSTHTIH